MTSKYDNIFIGLDPWAGFHVTSSRSDLTHVKRKRCSVATYNDPEGIEQECLYGTKTYSYIYNGEIIYTVLREVYYNPDLSFDIWATGKLQRDGLDFDYSTTGPKGSVTYGGS